MKFLYGIVFVIIAVTNGSVEAKEFEQWKEVSQSRSSIYSGGGLLGAFYFGGEDKSTFFFAIQEPYCEGAQNKGIKINDISVNMSGNCLKEMRIWKPTSEYGKEVIVREFLTKDAVVFDGYDKFPLSARNFPSEFERINNEIKRRRKITGIEKKVVGDSTDAMFDSWIFSNGKVIAGGERVGKKNYKNSILMAEMSMSEDGLIMSFLIMPNEKKTAVCEKTQSLIDVNDRSIELTGECIKGEVRIWYPTKSASRKAMVDIFLNAKDPVYFDGYKIPATGFRSGLEQILNTNKTN